MVKSQSRFLALLRGINVGGKNIIPKEDLRQCFEDLGFTNVRTYIQSGNVLFRSQETAIKKLTAAVENGLSQQFAYEARAVVLSRRKYLSAVEAAPHNWGKDDGQRHNALFTLQGITPRQALAKLSPPKTEIETVTAGPGVIFWSVSKQHVTKASLMKLVQEPVYQQMTIRNHNTVFKLRQLFETI